MFAFCCTAVAGGLSVEVGQTLGHYQLAWGCNVGAVRFCGMLSNCQSIGMSPKAGTISAPLQESGALFDFAAVPDLPACLRPPRHGGAAAGHWLSPPRELEVTAFLSDIGVFCDPPRSDLLGWLAGLARLAELTGWADWAGREIQCLDTF